MAENYPALKSSENVKMLQEELSGTGNKVGFARQFYNDIATKLNTAQQVLPTNLFAATFGFKAAEFFEIADHGDLEVPRLRRSTRPSLRRRRSSMTPPISALPIHSVGTRI